MGHPKQGQRDHLPPQGPQGHPKPNHLAAKRLMEAMQWRGRSSQQKKGISSENFQTERTTKPSSSKTRMVHTHLIRGEFEFFVWI